MLKGIKLEHGEHYDFLGKCVQIVKPHFTGMENPNWGFCVLGENGNYSPEISVATESDLDKDFPSPFLQGKFEVGDKYRLDGKAIEIAEPVYKTSNRQIVYGYRYCYGADDLNPWRGSWMPLNHSDIPQLVPIEPEKPAPVPDSRTLADALSLARDAQTRPIELISAYSYGFEIKNGKTYLKFNSQLSLRDRGRLNDLGFRFHLSDMGLIADSPVNYSDVAEQIGAPYSRPVVSKNIREWQYSVIDSSLKNSLCDYEIISSGNSIIIQFAMPPFISIFRALIPLGFTRRLYTEDCYVSYMNVPYREIIDAIEGAIAYDFNAIED